MDENVRAIGRGSEEEEEVNWIQRSIGREG